MACLNSILDVPMNLSAASLWFAGQMLPRNLQRLLDQDCSRFIGDHDYKIDPSSFFENSEINAANVLVVNLREIS